MNYPRIFLALALYAIDLPSCQKAPPASGGEAPTASAAVSSAEAPKDAGAPKSKSAEGAGRKFLVPFAWEASQAESLARARAFLANMSEDNKQYVQTHPPEFFKAFAAAQEPRATVLACSDSRVQSTAFDHTPENDVFTIRNIGDVFKAAEGSVEYGVRHLHTPVLLVLGHTGCGAVKAAMSGFASESDAIKAELSRLDVPKFKFVEPKAPEPKEEEEPAGEDHDDGEHADEAKGHEAKGHEAKGHEAKGAEVKGHEAKGAEAKGIERKAVSEHAAKEPKKTPPKKDLPVNPEETRAWADAVRQNVNNQVKDALVKFAPEVEQGKLTVIGAIYDFRNDLKRGAGKVVIVNVNGQTERATCDAFEKALTEAPSTAAPSVILPKPHH